jgi:hypothetical protein
MGNIYKSSSSRPVDAANNILSETWKSSKMEKHSASPKTVTNPSNSLLDDDESSSNATTYSGGTPGFGNGKLGPQIPRISNTVITSGTRPPSAMGSSSAINPNAREDCRPTLGERIWRWRSATIYVTRSRRRLSNDMSSTGRPSATPSFARTHIFSVVLCISKMQSADG